MDKSIYTSEKTCVMCDQPFKVTRVRARLSMISQDSDFCAHYKELNPYYYSIWVCPHCGYAAQDNYFEDLLPTGAVIKDFLASRKINVDFSGPRTREQAIATFKLAIFFAEMAGALASKLAGLYLRLAWLFREGDQSAEELLALDKAREYYELVFFKEKMPIGNLSELAVEYLCGELLRRTGKIPEALGYLGKIISNPEAKKERRIFDLARRSWEDTREAKRALACTPKPRPE